MYRHRQLHLWITDHDYRVLRTLANARQETLSSVIRRLIKTHQDEVARPVEVHRARPLRARRTMTMAQAPAGHDARATIDP